MATLPQHAYPVDPTAGRLRSTRSFGQPRGSSSLNTAAEGQNAAACAKPDPAASASAPLEAACCLETLAHASLALGMMSPPAPGAVSRMPTEETVAAPLPGRQRAQPEPLSLRSLPTGEVTKHPGVTNALKVPLPYTCSRRPAPLSLELCRLTAHAARAQVTLFQW